MKKRYLAPRSAIYARFNMSSQREIKKGQWTRQGYYSNELGIVAIIQLGGEKNGKPIIWVHLETVVAGKRHILELENISISDRSLRLYCNYFLKRLMRQGHNGQDQVGTCMPVPTNTVSVDNSKTDY